MEVLTLPCLLCCGRQWVNLGFLLIFMLCLQPTAPARIARIGNDIKPSASGVDVAGAVFLLEDAIMHHGVLFAYSAHFRSDKPISLQVWRPLGPGQMYKLVFNLRVVPAGIFQREDIYVVSKLVGGDCALVQPGDRVGVLFLEAPGAIAYTFQPNQAGALGSTLKQDKVNVTIGMNLEFEALTFPYEFSMAGYIDTNMSMYSLPANLTSLTIVALPCPIGLKIPSYGDLATPPPPVAVTGKPGEPGSPGPPGVDGLPGLPGAVGPIGPQGPPGFNGSRGPEGLPGMTGLRGPLGNQGPRGFGGPSGPAGPKGDKGNTGDMGPAGPTGPAGKDGRPGNAIDKTAASLSSEDGFLSSTMFSILLLVWMIVITVTIFILICLFICVAKRSRRHYGSSRSTSTSKQDISWGGGDMGHDNLYIAYMPDRNETDSAKAASSAGTRTLPHNPEQLPPPPLEVSATSSSAGGLRRSRSGNVSEFSYSHLANSGEGFKGETTKEFPIETVSPDEGSTSRPVSSSSRHGEFVLAPDPAYYKENPHRDYNQKYIHTNGTTPNGRHDYNYRM